LPSWSLYNYVANKGDLIDGILDLVLDESKPPSLDGEWDAAIRSSAISVHRSLTRHPSACSLLMSPGHIRPARLQHMDSLLARLREAGFSADATYHAYIYGFSLWQANHTYNAVQVTNMVTEFERMIPADVFPYLHEHGEQHFADGPHREVSAFEFGLDFILDGLKETRG
jgi:hypothetical protein